MKTNLKIAAAVVAVSALALAGCSSSSSSSSTTSRDPGEFIASGLGITSSKAGAGSLRGEGLDKVIEGAVMGIAGWLLMFL